MKKRLWKQLTSVTLAAALAGTLGLVAFADDPAGAPDSSYLLKYLEVGEGITIPDETFTFTFTQTAYNGATPADAYKVAIDDQTVTTNTGTWTATNDADDEGSIYTSIKLSEILAGVTFPAAGSYTYKVTETAGSTTGFTYDDNVYWMTVYITNNGTINITITDGETIDNGEKVDPTKTDPTKDEVETPGDDQVTVQGFTFHNKYGKTNQKDDKNEEGYLNISKEVSGDYADKTYPFEFSITLIKSATAPADDTAAKYSIYDKTAGANAAAISSGTVTYGTATTFTLKHNEVLRFYEVAGGTKYTVTETLSSSGVSNRALYTASATATVGGTAVTVGTVAAETDLEVGEYIIDDKLSTADDVDYTNTFDDDSITPTGVLIQNAPYILLALVAAGGMALYVIKIRREN